MLERLPAIGLLLGATVATGPGIGYALADPPHTEAAIGFLQSARGELQAAAANKAGRRMTATGLIDQAIHEVRVAMEATGDLRRAPFLQRIAPFRRRESRRTADAPCAACPARCRGARSEARWRSAGTTTKPIEEEKAKRIAGELAGSMENLAPRQIGVSRAIADERAPWQFRPDAKRGPFDARTLG